MFGKQGGVLASVVIIGLAVGATGPAGMQAAAAGDTPRAPAGAWQPLFAEEAWYKGQAGQEQIFAGTLEAVKPPEASTLQRNALYKLGDRTIYTGARRMPALDALAGKTVEVRGKPVDMKLEGQNIREIWPAAVRAADATTPVRPPAPAREAADS